MANGNIQGPYIGTLPARGVGNSVSIVQPQTQARSARMTISNSPQTIVFNAPYAPRTVSYSGFEATYNETTRPDRKPIVTRSGFSLRKMSMELFVGSTNPYETQDERLKTLEDLAQTIDPLIVEYDASTGGKWRITSLSYESVERHPIDNEITRATVMIEFTEIDLKSNMTINQVNNQRPKKVNVKAGDSLAKIVMANYGTDNPFIVKAVAKANDIDDPRHLPKKIILP